MKKLPFLLLCTIIISCNETLQTSIPDVGNDVNPSSAEYPVLQFDSSEAIEVYMHGGPAICTKSASGDFLSYAETIMKEPGYDDRENVILSERFGMILNPVGELEFSNYLLKVSPVGILFGTIAQRNDIVRLSQDSTILSLCNGTVSIPEISSEAIFHTIKGYDGIVLFDTFGLIDASNGSGIVEPETKSVSKNLINYPRNSFDLHFQVSWNAEFTVPPSGKQKVKFSDEDFCNDTKIYQQDYAVTSDGGLKTKTMRKRALGIWKKYSNQLEGGIINFSILESGNFSDINGQSYDISEVKYNGQKKTIYTISRRGNDLQAVDRMNLSSLITAGNSAAKSHGIKEEIDAVRFVISDTEAITRFPNDITSGTFEKIELNWPVSFGGSVKTPNSYILGGKSKIRSQGNYHVAHTTIYGQSTIENETRGSKMTYKYE